MRAMRIKKPRRASLDELRITRSGETAIIEHADPMVGTMSLTLGPDIHQMTNDDIFNKFNDIMDAQEQLAAEYENIVVEIPPGHPQIRYVESCDQWVPRGQVLRCIIDESEDGELAVHIDDKELSLQAFARLLLTYNGFGMRIAFVDEGDLYDEPIVEVRNTKENE